MPALSLLALLFFLCTLTLGVLFLALRLAAGHRRIYLPDAFVIATATHVIGALILFIQTPNGETVFMLSAAFLSFFTAAAFTAFYMTVSPLPQWGLPLTRFKFRAGYSIAMVGVVIVNGLIIALVLSNPAIFVLAIGALAATDQGALLDIRKAITASTEGYMSPGVIKILRDQISPIVIASYILAKPAATRSVLFWLTTLIVLLAMLIGGQRFPIVMLIIVLVCSLVGRRLIEGHRSALRPAHLLMLALSSLALFFSMSLLLGRTGESGSGVHAVFWTLASLLQRIFATPLLEAEKTFFYWHSLGPTLGASWWADLTMLLPGKSTSSFSSELHQLAGGSAEGNAPLFFAADAWLAFGWAGIVVTAFLFVGVLHYIDMVLWRFRSPSGDATRFLLFFNVPLMYSPFLFLLYGGLVAFAMCVLSIALYGNWASPHSRHA